MFAFADFVAFVHGESASHSKAHLSVCDRSVPPLKKTVFRLFGAVKARFRLCLSRRDCELKAAV